MKSYKQSNSIQLNVDIIIEISIINFSIYTTKIKMYKLVALSLTN